MGTLTGIEGAALISSTVYRQQETRVCFLRAGVAKESIQPMANAKKGGFCFGVGEEGEPKHSKAEYNELFCPAQFAAEKKKNVCFL